MVEVNDAVMHRVRQDDQVADVLRIEWNFHLQGVFHGTHRSDGVHRGADPADALRDGPGVARIASQQDQFHPAPHLAGRPGFVDLAAIDVDIDAQMAFNAGDRINGDAL